MHRQSAQKNFTSHQHKNDVTRALRPTLAVASSTPMALTAPTEVQQQVESWRVKLKY